MESAMPHSAFGQRCGCTGVRRDRSPHRWDREVVNDMIPCASVLSRRRLLQFIRWPKCASACAKDLSFNRTVASGVSVAGPRSSQSSTDFHFRCECQVHSAAVRERQQPRTLVLAKRSIQLNVSFDHRELHILSLAGDTILSVNSRMTKVHRDPLQPPLLSPRIHCNGHGSTGPKCGQQQIGR